MHVVIVSRRFPPQIGGAETALGRLAEGLGRRGNHVTVLCESQSGEITQRLIDTWGESAPCEPAARAVRVVPLQTSKARFWGTLRWMHALRAALNRLAAECDLFYVSMLKHSAYATVGVGRRRGVPVVLRPSGTGTTGDMAWQDRSLQGRLFRRRCRKADTLVSVSPQMRGELVARGYPEQNIRSIPGGVPIPEVHYEPTATQEFRRRLSLGDIDGPVAVYVGRFSAEKGLDDLVDAWGRVAAVEPGAMLVLVGEGPMLERLEQQVRGNRLETRVRFCGPTTDPEPFLRAADLFVLPSHQEGISNALLEAMALGLAVVASDIPGNRVAVADEDRAVLVPARQPDQLADAVLELFGDPERRRALGHAARRHAAECFNLRRVVDAHLQLFEELRRGRGRTLFSNTPPLFV